MNTHRCLTALFLATLLGQRLLAEPPGASLPGVKSEAAPVPQPLSWELVFAVPGPDFVSGHWQDWVTASKLPKRGTRIRPMPGATVEVVDWFVDAQKERVLELNAAWAPVLARSFQMGWRSPYTAQMLSEFMGMHGANFHPPTIPSVFYNGLIPYWVQQGWGSASGGSSLRVNVNAEPRHMMLYPGRR